MTIETLYKACDGTIFTTMNECLSYETEFKRIAGEELSKAIQHIDELLWKKYHSAYDIGSLIAPLDQAHIWLKSDIGVILSHDTKEINLLKDEILAFISDHEHGSEIIEKYINMDALMEEAIIRRDFETALSKVKKGSALSGKLNWSFGPEDLKTLASIHQKGKYRKKIEDLLTDCNFHYECSKFSSHDYAEFFVSKNGGAV